MKDRIAKIIKKEQLTSQQFAEIIEIQSSTISHILAGRNLPSFKIISNLLERFPKISPDWLIFGKGEMYRIENKVSVEPDITIETDDEEDEFTKLNLEADFEGEIDDNTSEIDIINVFDPNNTIHGENALHSALEQPLFDHLTGANEPPVPNHVNSSETGEKVVGAGVNSQNTSLKNDKSAPMPEKIIVMYSDNTFEIFNPKI